MKLEEQCKQKRIELKEEDDADEEDGFVQHLLKFRRKLRDVKEGGASGASR